MRPSFLEGRWAKNWDPSVVLDRISVTWEETHTECFPLSDHLPSFVEMVHEIWFIKLWGCLWSPDELFRRFYSARLKLRAAELFTSSSLRKQFMVPLVCGLAHISLILTRWNDGTRLELWSVWWNRVPWCIDKSVLMYTIYLPVLNIPSLQKVLIRAIIVYESS